MYQQYRTNLLLLNELNQNVKIYVLGFYYSPLFDLIQKVIFLQEKIKYNNNKFEEIINLYNLLLKQLCENYDFVEYIDISFIRNYCAPLDFHPNTKGNELIAYEILKKMKIENKYLNGGIKNGRK